MKKEKYYEVFDYGDRLTPSSELKIEHTVVSGNNSNALDLKPFIELGTEKLTSARDESIKTEAAIYEKIRASITEWERQAAVTRTYNRALEYRKTPSVSHSSNQWEHDNRRDEDTISNMVYKMRVSVWENKEYDREKQDYVPVAWYVTWNVRTNSPKSNYNEMIAGQDRKQYTDKAAAMKYIEGRKKAFARLFKEISPPIPQEYAQNFEVNGVLLPGYTVEGREPVVSTKTADEFVNEILGGDSLSADKKPSVLQKLSEGKSQKAAPSKGAKTKEEQSI